MSNGRTLAALVAGALLSSGCLSIPSPYGLVDRAVGRTVDSAADRAGERVGDQVGSSLAARYNPMLSQIYMQMVFSMAFGSGGYAVGQTGYKTGDYTRWSIPSGGSEEKGAAKESTLERAYLFNDRDGNAWWKVKWVLDPAKAGETTLIVEALFEKGTGKLLRQRVKMPNEQQGKEVPVEDATYYQPPRQLTKQSLEGAMVGVERVTVPAGSFTARHVSYGDMGGSADFWLSDAVPGGAVKYLHKAQGGSERTDAQNWEMLLVAYGKGASSELGITR